MTRPTGLLAVAFVVAACSTPATERVAAPPSPAATRQGPSPTAGGATADVASEPTPLTGATATNSPRSPSEIATTSATERRTATTVAEQPQQPAQAPGPDESENDPRAAQPRPPTPGTYRYDTDGSMTVTGGQPRPLPEITTFTVRAGASGQQHVVRDVRDRDGHGQMTEMTLTYGDGGVFLSRVKVTTDVGGGVRDVREWRLDPPQLLVAAGARPGDSRRFTMRNPDTTADVGVDLLRREDVAVAGQTVATVVTRIRIELSGALEGTLTTTAWMRPADLLTVREDVEGDVRNGPLQVVIRYTADLQTLTPRP